MLVTVDDGSAGTLGCLEEFRADSLVHRNQLDVRNRHAMSWIIRSERPWGIVHLAACHFIPECERDPAITLDVNVMGTQCLLDACVDHPPAHFVFASTADVYRASTTPHAEEDQTGPIGVYGSSKLLGEWLIRDQAYRCPNTDFVVCRLFNIYGPGDGQPHLIPEIITQSRRSDSLILGDLSPLRDFVFVEDAAEAVVALLETAKADIYNVGTGVPTSGQNLLRLIGQLLGREVSNRIDPTKHRLIHRQSLWANPARLRNTLPWWPRTNLIEGLQRTLDHDTDYVHVYRYMKLSDNQMLLVRQRAHWNGMTRIEQ